SRRRHTRFDCDWSSDVCSSDLLFSLEAIDAGKILGQYLFSKRESGLLVELHNDLTLRYFPRPLPIDDFFARKVAVRLDAHEVPAPCVEDELVLICIHGARSARDGDSHPVKGCSMRDEL